MIRRFALATALLPLLAAPARGGEAASVEFHAEFAENAESFGRDAPTARPSNADGSWSRPYQWRC